MSAKPETTFYTGVHKHLPSDLYRVKMFNPYAGGIFDFYFSGRRDTWVEYKWIVLPKRSATLVKPGLSPLQLDWGTRRRTEGRNVLVIVGCKEGGVVLKDPANWQSIPQHAFVAMLKTRAELAQQLVKETA